MDGKELIWVGKEFAERYKLLDDDKTKREQQIKMFNEYLEGLQKTSRDDFKANLECLDEDVAIYKGLMISVKQAFEAAKNEQLQASYDLWEKFDKDMPNIREKTTEVVKALDPLVDQLTKINELLGKIQIWDFEKLIKTVENFSNLYGESKDMIEFLVNHFTPKQKS